MVSDNLMKSNSDKCQLLVSINNTVNIKIGNIDITNCSCGKLLGVKFAHKLTFDDHISELCKKARGKIHTLARITTYMNLSKKGILMNAFFNSQFSYCHLWICHSRANNSKINRLHERCLRIIYSDKQSSYEAFSEKDCSVSIHSRNLRILATKMYKVGKGLSPPL